MLELTPRTEAPAWLRLASPIAALVVTLSFGILLFHFVGKEPFAALELFFWEPLKNARALGELALKASPVLLIALGLSLCFRTNVWNIGAEGQFILGAIGASWVSLHARGESGPWLVAAALLAGALGGIAWAALCAFFREHFHASEILTSLMLVYVAEQLLSYLVHGPWKDPNGYNFPQTITFLDAARLPRLGSGSRAHAGLLLVPLAIAGFWLFQRHSHAGYRLRVVGLSPRAALYAGFAKSRAIYTALLASGATAGLAGAMEVCGPVGQLTPHVPLGYGFAGIIAAFVGRLHPIGVTLSSLLMSLFYIGGELSQSRLGLPKSVTGVFEGVLLFALLACDTLVQNRVRLTWPFGSRSITP
ncbi:MAG TPA: ABC transporter permease [Polyangiaceae bacterium]|nr:ABC transporter permease [Polyangiaceae bacterium]